MYQNIKKIKEILADGKMVKGDFKANYSSDICDTITRMISSDYRPDPDPVSGPLSASDINQRLHRDHAYLTKRLEGFPEDQAKAIAASLTVVPDAILGDFDASSIPTTLNKFGDMVRASILSQAEATKHVELGADVDREVFEAQCELHALEQLSGLQSADYKSSKLNIFQNKNAGDAILKITKTAIKKTQHNIAQLPTTDNFSQSGGGRGR